MSNCIVKAYDYNCCGPRNGQVARCRGPERCNKHQSVANVRDQNPRKIALYVVDLLGAYPKTRMERTPSGVGTRPGALSLRLISGLSGDGVPWFA